MTVLEPGLVDIFVGAFEQTVREKSVPIGVKKA
jgi:hypothetical protein